MVDFKASEHPYAIIIGLLVTYLILKAVYRITVHPLAKFPGPKLAALTYKYEFYYDGVKVGQYTNKIAELHRQYGPIIRINPDELHCNDPGFMDQIYPTSGKKRNKSTFFLKGFSPQSMLATFGTVDHDVHRMRRAAVQRFFSKASISKFEVIIHDLVQKLCDKLNARIETSEPLEVASAYSCFTTDVISNYCFGQSQGLLDQDDFEPNFRAGILGGCKALPVVKQWPIIANIIDILPDSVAKKMSPDLSAFLDYLADFTKYVTNFKKKYDAGEVKDLETRKSIFHDILGSDLPEHEKTPHRLGAEAIGFIGAGTETTAWNLATLTYYLLAKPDILRKVADELKTKTTDPRKLPPWTELERLPYFSAIILESIRLSYGVATRLARIAPEETLHYDGTDASGKAISLQIPQGTAIGMTSVLVHHNQNIFPNSEQFLPERWLNEDGSRHHDLEKYLFSFGKGSRICLGMNLAYCELYVGLAALTLRFFPTVELFETTENDVKYHHDMFVLGPAPESKGVRVRAKRS